MSSSASLPSPDDDYAAPLDAALNKAFWDAALTSIAARIRVLEAVKVEWETLIAQGTGQALAVIQANVAPQLAALTAVIDQLKADIAAAEDAIAVIVAGGISMSNVVGLATALSEKVSAAELTTVMTAMASAMKEYVSYVDDQALSTEQRERALANLGLSDIHNTLTPISMMATAAQADFVLGTVVSPGACLVFQNGAKLSPIDYSLTTTMLSLTTAAAAGDTVTVIAIGTFDVADALKPAANLADLGSAAAARLNLGLGPAALEAAGTAANQLLKLDSAGKLPLSALWPGMIVGRAYAEYTAQAGHTALIPTDATIPQITEGEEILSAVYTPKIAGSRLRIKFSGMSSNDSQGYGTAAAMFLNGAANAINTVMGYTYNGTCPYMLAMECEITPSGLTPQTVAIRVGPNGGTQRMNAAGTAATFGGVPKTTLIIEEIAP